MDPVTRQEAFLEKKRTLWRANVTFLVHPKYKTRVGYAPLSQFHTTQIEERIIDNGPWIKKIRLSKIFTNYPTSFMYKSTVYEFAGVSPVSSQSVLVAGLIIIICLLLVAFYLN